MRIIRQTFVILKQNPLLSTISILGTAFAITMIMAIVITWQTKYADLEPEVNRSRCLYFSAMHVYDKEKDGNNNWSNPSAAFMKECVQPVPEVEYCTAFSPAGLSLASLTDGNNRVKVDAMRTDPDFWKVFSMQFLAGRGFSEADRAGESKAVVVCASVARKLYGSTDVVGQEFLLNRELARIVGVVKDVSVTAKDAYAQVWGMYSADELKITGVHSYLGGMQIAVLARTSDDFPAIREGIAKQVERVNAGLGNKQIDIMEQPDNIVAHVNHVWANVGPDLTMLYLQYAVALFIILLVPSLNLCGLSNSRMQQRITELGVRKAFGGTKSVLVRQILNENLMLTLLGGVVGLLFSYLAVYAMRMWLFTNNQNVGTSGEFSLNMEALFSPWVFLLAFVFCVVINLLSAALPAWIAARHTIVDSLNKRITFLNHLFKELELDHIQAVASRAEDFCKDHRESFDIVMARAVARLNILDELCLPLVKKDGYFLSLKGLKAPEELKDAKGGIKVLGGEVMDDFTFTLSDQNDHRHNIVIKKVKSTPAKYPRNYGQIKKKPL